MRFLLYGEIELLELAYAGDRVVGGDMYPAPLLGFGLNSVRIGEPSTASERVETAFERLAARQPQHGIDTVGSQSMRGFRDVLAWPVDGGIGAKTAHESQAVLT